MSATATAKTAPAHFIGNPLVKFRAPKNFRRSDVRGGYFTARRGDISNGDGTLEIYPDDFRYKVNPSMEIDVKLWEDYDDQRSVANYIRLVQRGYQVATSETFEVNPAITLLWAGDQTGRISYAGKSKGYILMWCTGAQYDINSAKSLRFSDDVQAHARADQERFQDRLNATGYNAQASITIEDDDSAGGSRSKSNNI